MAYEPTGVYDRISELNSDLAEGQHDAEEANYRHYLFRR